MSPQCGSGAQRTRSHCIICMVRGIKLSTRYVRTIGYYYIHCQLLSVCLSAVTRDVIRARNSLYVRHCVAVYQLMVINFRLPYLYPLTASYTGATTPVSCPLTFCSIPDNKTNLTYTAKCELPPLNPTSSSSTYKHCGSSGCSSFSIHAWAALATQLGYKYIPSLAITAVLWCSSLESQSHRGCRLH